MSTDSTIKNTLIYFKKKLERTSDDETLILIIHKLSKVPITLDLLQGTGAGKAVRALAKRQDRVGIKASSVLNKWREIISQCQKLNDNLNKSDSKTITNSKEFSPTETISHSNHKQNKLEKHSKEKQSKDKHSKDKYSKEKHSKEKHSKVKHSKEKSEESLEILKEKFEKAKQEQDLAQFSEKNSTTENFFDKLGKSKQSFPSCEKISLSGHSLNFQQNSRQNVDDCYTPEYTKVNKTNISDASISYEPTKKSKLPEKNLLKNCDLSKQEKRKHLHSLVSDSSKNTEKNFEFQQPQKKKSLNGSKKDYSNSSCEKSVSNHEDNKKVKNDKSKSKSKNKLSKKSLKIIPAEEFTASEASFEDCLSFNDIVSVKKRKVSKTTLNPVVKKLKHSSKQTEKSTKTKKETLSPKSLTKKNGISPTEWLEPEDIDEKQIFENNEVDISSTLPQTQPFYRPLPQKSYLESPVKKKVMSNEEAIKFTSSRREKTAVYSGRKNCHLTEVPSLFECCTRVLIDNIDDIEYMGEIPYFLLESMLQRCTASQLYRIEHYNPYLLEDTNELWEKHCKRDYRCAKPQESETWRELYWRSHEEQEKKLRSVTANISASIAKSNPVRKAKLAYVDSVVKPPRDVARRQAKNGTGLVITHPIKHSPPIKTSSSSVPAVNPVSAIKARVEIKLIKPKVAPLMAKTLKSMKQCFRR